MVSHFVAGCEVVSEISYFGLENFRWIDSYERIAGKISN